MTAQCDFTQYFKNQKELFADFFKTSVLKNFANFTERAPMLDSLFNKVAGLWAFFTEHLGMMHLKSMFYSF